MRLGIGLCLAAVVCLSGCEHVPIGSPPGCEAPPISGLEEYAHLLDLQFALVSEELELDAACDPALSSLFLTAIGEHPARQCLPGLDRMLATFERSCAALDAWREE